MKTIPLLIVPTIIVRMFVDILYRSDMISGYLHRLNIINRIAVCIDTIYDKVFHKDSSTQDIQEDISFKNSLSLHFFINFNSFSSSSCLFVIVVIGLIISFLTTKSTEISSYRIRNNSYTMHGDSNVKSSIDLPVFLSDN